MIDQKVKGFSSLTIPEYEFECSFQLATWHSSRIAPVLIALTLTVIGLFTGALVA